METPFIFFVKKMIAGGVITIRQKPFSRRCSHQKDFRRGSAVSFSQTKRVGVILHALRV